jgi:hypothetical protein
MSASISINFANAIAVSNSVTIVFQDATVSPGLQNGVAVAMASALTNVTVLSGEVMFATATSAQFNGSIAIAIAWTDGHTPTVTLNNLQNSGSNHAMVTWPTSAGPQTQILTPGDPMPLTGIIDN